MIEVVRLQQISSKKMLRKMWQKPLATTGVQRRKDKEVRSVIVQEVQVGRRSGKSRRLLRESKYWNPLSRSKSRWKGTRLLPRKTKLKPKIREKL